jgi:hypothetical protein
MRSRSSPYVNQAELSHPYVRACLEKRGATVAPRAGRKLRKENQEDHDRQRVARGTVSAGRTWN